MKEKGGTEFSVSVFLELLCGSIYMISYDIDYRTVWFQKLPSVQIIEKNL